MTGLLEKRSTRVIVLNGHGDDALREKALSNGAMHFLDKPFDDGELVGLVRQALAGAS